MDAATLRKPAAADAAFPTKAKMLFRAAPYKVMYGGRGSSKTWSFGRALLILGSRKKLFILCAREIQKSIRDSVHKLLADQVDALGLGWFYKVGTTSITGANGTEFVFAGIKTNITSIKSMEAIDICAVFEATFISQTSWEILLPTIRRDAPHGPFGQGSEVWVEFNPELDSDYTYRYWVANPPPGAVVVEINYHDNPWFPDILERQKEEMRERDYDSYLTVWEGKTRKVLKGAIYAKEIAKAIEEGRIGPNIRHDRTKPVDVSFDLGRADLCAMWFWQQRGMDHVAFDYYGAVGEDFAHFVLEIQKRGYVIGRIYLPHDASHHAQSAAKSIETQAREAFPGEGRVIVNDRIPNIALGLNIVRGLWPRIYINDHACADGFMGLQHYQFEVDPETNERSSVPLHNWASNPADAFRTYAEGLRPPEGLHSQPVPRGRGLRGGGNGWLRK